MLVDDKFKKGEVRETQGQIPALRNKWKLRYPEGKFN